MFAWVGNLPLVLPSTCHSPARSTSGRYRLQTKTTIVRRTITAAVVGIGIASVSLGLLAAGLGAITSEVSGPRWIPACPISDCVAAFQDNGPIVAPGAEHGSGASPTHLAILAARRKEP